jgi:UDP-N-acetylmuramoyl-tripeptide--D-alanyl-D-alanine ligase
VSTHFSEGFVHRMIADFRKDPLALAELTNGRWDKLPTRIWTMERLMPVAEMRGFSSEGPGTLLYARRPGNSARLLRRLHHTSRRWGLLVEESARVPETEIPVLRVQSLRQALDRIALASRTVYQGKVLAVTGSVGKTTVRRMLDRTLSAHHGVGTSRTSENGYKVIRQQLVRLTDQEYATFEVARIALPGSEQLIRPDVAVIGALAEAHLAELGSMEKIAQLKGQLIYGLTPGGTAVINADSLHVGEVFKIAEDKGCKIITYGENRDADIRLLSLDYSINRCDVSLFGERFNYALTLSGKHNAVNSLAVLGALTALDLPVSNYLNALSTFKPVRRRGTVDELRVDGKEVTLVDESFNANPTSMRAAIESFGIRYADRRKVVVLGDMLELGDHSAELHRELASLLLKVGAERIFLTGPSMWELHKALPASVQADHFESPDEALAQLSQGLNDYDAVLLKASNGMGLNKVVEGLRAASDQDGSRQVSKRDEAGQ